MTIPFLQKSCVAFALDASAIRWAVVEGRLRSPRSIVSGTIPCDPAGQVMWPPEVDSALAKGRVGIIAHERFVRHNRHVIKTTGAGPLAYDEILDRFLSKPEHTTSASDFCFGSVAQRNSEEQIVSAISQLAVDRSTKPWMGYGVTVTAVSSLVHELPYALAYLTTFMERDTFVAFASRDYCSLIHYRSGLFRESNIVTGTSRECAGKILATYLEEYGETNTSPLLVCGPESESLLTALSATDNKIARAASMNLPWKNQSPVPDTHLDVAGLAIRLFFEQHPTFDFRTDNEVESALNQTHTKQLRSAGLAASVVTGAFILVLASLVAIAYHRVNRAKSEHARLTTLAAEAHQSQRLAAASDEEEQDYNSILNRQSNVARILEDTGRSIPAMTMISELNISPNDSSRYRRMTIHGQSPDAASLTTLAVGLNSRTTIRKVDITRVTSKQFKNVSSASGENREYGVNFVIQAEAIDLTGVLHD